jgi:hypothetical protein
MSASDALFIIRLQLRRFPLQLGLSPRPVVNHLMATVVGHLLRPSNFNESSKTPDAQLALAIKGAYIDAW